VRRNIILGVLFFLVILVFGNIGFQLWRDRPENIIRKICPDNAAVLPRVLEYELRFISIPVGISRIKFNGFEDYLGRKVLWMSADASVSGFLAKFIDGKALVESWVDTQNMHTVKFRQVLTLPDKPVDVKEIIYDQKNNIMHLNQEKRVIFPDTQDVLSLVYMLCNAELYVGKEFDINVNTNQQNYRFLIKVVRSKGVVLKDRIIPVWTLEGTIRRRNKSLRHSSSVSIVLAGEKNKIPILGRFTSNAGVINARLTGFQSQ